MVHPKEWLNRVSLDMIKFNAYAEIPQEFVDSDRSALEDGIAATAYIHTPAIAESYIPPVIPRLWDENMHAARANMTLSALCAVADIWAELLVRNRDKVDKPIYMLWDEEIPLPSPATALFWLMVCETWPMPAKVAPSMPITNLTQAFPFQTIIPPQSGHMLYATQYPPEFTAPPRTRLPGMQLDGLLKQHMTREDRTRMAMTKQGTILYRPQEDHIQYRSHAGHGRISVRWNDGEGWPTTPVAQLDCGIAYTELMTSWWHLKLVQELRSQVMNNMLTQPGMPTHQDSLYTCPGGWIRQFSETGIAVNGPQNMAWTRSSDPVALHTGKLLKHVPSLTPRIWFGWTQVGPEYGVEDGKPTRKTSAIERWVMAYMKVRSHALGQLMYPRTVQIENQLEEHFKLRESRLTRAGRLAKANTSTAAFAEMFKKVVKPLDSSKEN